MPAVEVQCSKRRDVTSGKRGRHHLTGVDVPGHCGVLKVDILAELLDGIITTVASQVPHAVVKSSGYRLQSLLRRAKLQALAEPVDMGRVIRQCLVQGEGSSPIMSTGGSRSAGSKPSTLA